MSATQHAHALPLAASQRKEVEKFREEVVAGLTSHPKHLSSKYLYDAHGDALFQQIMACPEYYLTRCESEIFRNQATQLVDAITNGIDGPFDLVELGVGDGSKSRYLLKALLEKGFDFTYWPIDISTNILSELRNNLKDLPQLELVCLQGEYFDMLAEAAKALRRPKVVLFLGANIGNMPPADARMFSKQLRQHLRPGDRALIGFDLKKNPFTVLDAYNDRAGITRDFNLNLLQRINRELDGEFNIGEFKHFQTYDPETGACKSYLVSAVSQTVNIGDRRILFAEGEWIYMEISQKYSLTDIERLAESAGFVSNYSFTDSCQWFVDAMWTAV